MPRTIFAVTCLAACLLIPVTWSDASPATPELPSVGPETPAPPAVDAERALPDAEPEVRTEPFARPAWQSKTAARGAEGCETVLDLCRRACCYEYFECVEFCGTDLWCYYLCDQQDAACVAAC